MNLFSKENFGYFLAIVGAIGSLPVFKGYVVSAWSINSVWKLRRLRRERDLLTRLQNSDRELISFLLTSILVAIALLGGSLMFHGAGVGPNTRDIIPLSDWAVGFLIYMFCVNRLGKINRLKKFEETLMRLDAEIAKLERNHLK
jgi:hypothetical protein